MITGLLQDLPKSSLKQSDNSILYILADKNNLPIAQCLEPIHKFVVNRVLFVAERFGPENLRTDTLFRGSHE